MKRLYYSYASEDAAHQQALERHLALLQRDGHLQTWHRGCMGPGLPRDASAERELAEADLIVLLLSAHYFAVDPCYTEMQRALAAAQAGRAQVIPVLLRAVDLAGSPLDGRPTWPPDGRPLTPRADEEAAWREVAQGIRQAASSQVHGGEEAATPRTYEPVERPQLAQQYGRVLEQQRRLLLLAPRWGGARTLARQVVAAAGYGDSLTWLRPPSWTRCTEAQYFATLTSDGGAHDAFGYHEWQQRRCAGRRHLIVLLHDGGPREPLESLADVLRGLLEEAPRLSVLVAGEARSAALRLCALDTSLFSGMPVRRVPELTVAEVQEVLGRAGMAWSRAPVLHGVTSGHPGYLRELLGSDGSLEEGPATERLARSPRVEGILRRRLLEDDRADEGRRHSAQVLRALLAGDTVRPLSGIAEDLKYGEVRLYYDGLVREAEGRTAFRCAAARVAAAAALEAWEGSR